MIRHAEGLPWAAHWQAPLPKVGEGVERAFVDHVAVYIDERRAVRVRDNRVAVPDLVK
jgi:hypothetical protein